MNLLKSKQVEWVLFRLSDSGEIENDIARAIERYEERHGEKPNAAYCEGEKLGKALAAQGLTVRPAAYCGSLFYYIGHVPGEVTDVEN
jgi:hypothetical protein